MTYRCFKFRCYVGPVHVAHYAEQARNAGFLNVSAGTEHVWGTTPPLAWVHEEGDRQVLRQQIANKVYGSPMTAGYRDVELMA